MEHISDVEWDNEAFDNLVLSEDRKDVVQALVRAHNQNPSFNDIVKGKGEGLIFNLFGPPGCGKTLTAEATSEHLRRPLYVVNAGDLGVNAVELDIALENIFDMAVTWNAIVLIDEVRKLIATYPPCALTTGCGQADVFMEKRMFNDFFRNAMVAVL